ncbi:MAG: transcriptional coactivator p15/PC4 family protein [Candidatus Saccharicenans sp.]|nr:transcriptional coactivator p15/PC4 family protein [Candidatus Saccharicenans sp.]
MDQNNLRLISEFNKNSVELVKVHLSTFRGRDYVDIRVWHLQDPGGPRSELPTKKGICLSVDLLAEFFQAIDRLREFFDQKETKDFEGLR